MVSEETDEPAATPPKRRARTLWAHRFALVQAVLVVVAVLIALPIALRSMDVQLTDRQSRTLYDFPSGHPATAEMAQAVEGKESFLNVAAIDLDEAMGTITLAISGHRTCVTCAKVDLTLFSLDDNASLRRALPPSAPLTLDDNETVFSQTVQLPIRGQPSQYPFDDYVLWLGLAGKLTLDGETTLLTTEALHGHMVLTTQNQLRDYLMTQPTEIDPARVRAVADPFDFIGVQALRFERPIHLEILSVLLIMLIAVSAIIAVFMRNMTDVVVGLGSLILGVWGVRSVLVPSRVSVVTSVDLALSLVILFVLLGLTARAAHYFHRQSELPPLPRRRIRRKRG